MVALLHPAHLRSPEPVARRTRSAARHLRVVEAPAKAKTATNPLSMVAVVAVMATVLLVVLVRGVQGAPPAADWEGLVETSAPSAAASPVASSGTVTVLEGDTWATLAERVAPGVDPVAFARSLASANDGYRIEAGQVLAVPSVD